MERQVKGAIFLDFVKMIKKYKESNWQNHLTESDLALLNELILPSRWYPLDTMVRIGEAVFKELANGNLEATREWGWKSMDNLVRVYKNHLVVEGNPMRSLERFAITNRSLFNFEGLTIEPVSDTRARVTVSNEFGERLAEAYCTQMLGAFERLIDLSGGKQIYAAFASRRWMGDPQTVIELAWRSEAAAAQAAKRKLGSQKLTMFRLPRGMVYGSSLLGAKDKDSES